VVATTPRTVRGRITVVQEERFRLLTDDGRGLLLDLAADANVDADELLALRDAGTHVAVEYEGEPNLASGVARRVVRER
jgi:urease accessory protein UreE